MLNSRLIRRQDAELHLQAMAYLIRTFGPPAKPPVPSPLHKTKGLENLAWSELDTRTVYNWAEDIFATLRTFGSTPLPLDEILIFAPAIPKYYQDLPAGHRPRPWRNSWRR